MRSREEKEFEKKIRELLRKARDMEEDSVQRALALLSRARTEVAAQVAQTEWQAYRLPQLKGSIDRTMRELATGLGADIRQAQRDMWEHGVEMTDLPLRQAGIYQAMPLIDSQLLLVMQDYSVDLVTGLTRDASRKIGLEISRGLMGQKTPYDVMQAVGESLDDKGIFPSIARRAETIVRTEAGRALETAAQARREKAAEVVPGLKKQWMHGTSRVPRISHLAAHGQLQDVDKPFAVGGEMLMYPRDPAGSAKNTVNCSCYTIPWKDEWGEGMAERLAAAV